MVPQATAEEDEVMEIERAAPKPQSIQILRKRGEEVVVVEEENTTREIKRLKSAVAGVMTQIEGIAQIADQQHQLLKRMEPLAEENKILWEALSLSEKSIQRAQHERDLAESNSRDLEHWNGVLSERLTAAFEQLKKTSEQLATVSEELKNMSEQLGKKNGELDSKTEQLDRKCQQLEDVSKLKSEQDAELNQLRQTVKQIRQEKMKESGRADKLAKELKVYVLVQEAKVQKDNFNTITAAIKPVLNCVNVEPSPHPDGPILIELVDNQRRIPIYHEAFDAELDGYTETIETCFVLRGIVGGRKMYTENISEFVLCRCDEQNARTNTIDVKGAIEVHHPVLGASGGNGFLDLGPLSDEISKRM
ncbi:uncharacterized protein [Miscanthus floridulus]|uniref:uncharacterized protein n=1 Tax=Miscanthus floridulus TaxID=154761 RepID=UPI003459F091